MRSEYRVKRIYTEEETDAIIAVCYDLLYEEEFEKYLGYPDEFDGKENASNLLSDSTYEMSDKVRAEIEEKFGVAEFNAEQNYDDGYQFYDFGDDDFEDDREPALVGESFDLREALNQLDVDTDNKYDLLNLYEACDLDENEKRVLANIVYDNSDPSVIYDTLNDRFLGKEIEMPERVKDGVIHETTNRELDAKDVDLRKRITTRLGTDSTFGTYSKWTDEERKEDTELGCIRSLHSLLTYSPNHDIERVMSDEYLQKYIRELGEQRVRELALQEIEEFANATIHTVSAPDGGNYYGVSFARDKVNESKSIKEAAYEFKCPKCGEDTADELEKDSYGHKTIRCASCGYSSQNEDEWEILDESKSIKEDDEFEFDDEFNAYYDGYTKEAEDENSAANRLKRNQVNESYDFKGLNRDLRKELPADEIDYHDSDLYVKATPEAKKILKRYGIHNHPLVSTFIDQQTHTRWFDLPFAYCPVEDDTQPELEEGWTHFTYKSGANPYIAKTDDEAKKVLGKYKGRVKQVKDGEYEIDDTETDKFKIEESVKKSIKEGFYRGAQGVEFIGHGSWSDPELAYNGYTFNYWDIEDALWSMFLDETGYKDSQSDDPEIEEAFDKYVQNNVTDYLDECAASGAFNGLAVEGEIIEFPCGDYYYVRYDNGKLSLDGDYEIEYDFDNSIDSNLQALYDKAVETSPWLVSDGEDDVNESLFDDDEDKAYTYKQVYDELKLETKNFTIDGDTISYGFESEAENAVKILKRHYNSVECTNCKITFKDKKSKKK